MVTTDAKLDLTAIMSAEARRVLGVYGRSRSIYRRTVAAMGRVAKYHVTIATTADLKAGDVKRAS
jgi:hypothetical protein